MTMTNHSQRDLREGRPLSVLSMTSRLSAGWPLASCLMACLAVCGLSGCGSRSVPISDREQATQLLTETLKAWESGATVEQLRQQSPPVFVAEELWLSGAELDRYEITAPAEQFGTNVRFGVRLTYSERSGSKRDRDVQYLVTTTPALTVAREDR